MPALLRVSSRAAKNKTVAAYVLQTGWQHTTMTTSTLPLLLPHTPAFQDGALTLYPFKDCSALLAVDSLLLPLPFVMPTTRDGHTWKPSIAGWHTPFTLDAAMREAITFWADLRADLPNPTLVTPKTPLTPSLLASGTLYPWQAFTPTPTGLEALDKACRLYGAWLSLHNQSAWMETPQGATLTWKGIQDHSPTCSPLSAIWQSFASPMDRLSSRLSMESQTKILQRSQTTVPRHRLVWEKSAHARLEASALVETWQHLLPASPPQTA
jgi:hypothetical protein